MELRKTFDIDKLVFLDETSVTTAMTRLYGRGLVGTRVVGKAPRGHWHSSTFIAGLRNNALTAPAVFDGPIDGDCFKAYVNEILVPTLNCGDIVILDNVAFHKVAGIREAIEAVGAKLLYLPPYSPDFNPIEQFFAKLKSLLRKAANRTLEELWNCIGKLLDQCLPKECFNYFKNSGYCTGLN